MRLTVGKQAEHSLGLLATYPSHLSKSLFVCGKPNGDSSLLPKLNELCIYKVPNCLSGFCSDQKQLCVPEAAQRA